MFTGRKITYYTRCLVKNQRYLFRAHAADTALIKALLHAMYVFAVSTFFRVGEINKTGKLNQHYLIVSKI